MPHGLEVCEYAERAHLVFWVKRLPDGVLTLDSSPLHSDQDTAVMAIESQHDFVVWATPDTFDLVPPPPEILAEIVRRADSPIFAALGAYTIRLKAK